MTKRQKLERRFAQEVVTGIERQITAEELSVAFWVNETGLLPEGPLLEASRQAAHNAQVALRHLQEARKLFMNV